MDKSGEVQDKLTSMTKFHFKNIFTVKNQVWDRLSQMMALIYESKRTFSNKKEVLDGLGRTDVTRTFLRWYCCEKSYI